MKAYLEIVSLNTTDVVTTSDEGWCMPECGGELP